MSDNVTFIIPGLLDPVPYLNELPHQELPSLNTLSTFLSRGQWSLSETASKNDYRFYDCLLDELVLNDFRAADTESPESPFEQNPGVAAVSMAYDQQYASADELSIPVTKLNGQWIMRVDPCYMTADRDQLVMARTQDMALDWAEAVKLVDAINEFYQDYSEEQFWTLYALSPERWYILSDRIIDVQTTPPEKVLGQSLKNHLLTGADSQHWLNLFNEWQMILHQNPVNKQRLTDNKLPVNSVWLWGAGQVQDCAYFSQQPSQPLCRKIIYSDNVYVKGLGKLSQQTVEALPKAYQPITSADLTSKSNGKHEQMIYVIEDLIRALYNRDVFGWVGLLQEFESHFLEPLMKDILSRHIKQAELVSPSGTRLLLNRRLLRRWWRKKQPFYRFL